MEEEAVKPLLAAIGGARSDLLRTF